MAIWAAPEVTNLLTDYLIVGAGAMGLAFLEELIRSSTDMEATQGLPPEATGTMLTTLSVYINRRSRTDSTRAVSGQGILTIWQVSRRFLSTLNWASMPWLPLEE